MRKIILLAALWSGMSICATAQENPLWLRQSSISPDGSTIAFCYKGDNYTVPVSGGDAHQLTTNEAYDTRPVWSPDGSKIAFASDREGNMDIYVMSSKGGAPLRLTTAAQAEQPLSFKDDNTVLYLAYIRPATEDMQFPSNSFKEVYEVPVGGGKPKMVTSWTMENLNVSPDGKAWLFNDKKGYEDEWRKHHTSSITRDIWKYDVASKSFEKLTSFVGEDRNPVWTSDGKSFFYLSEQAGSFNIFKKSVNGGNPQQITHFTTHPVRFLTGAKNGTLCFSYNGELYTLKEGNEPQKLNVRILTDKIEKDVIRQIKRSGATDFAVSPSGKEVAFIIRGDVYVTNVEYNTTKQITDTPEQERNIDFAPDGRSLVYSSERNGVWQIWQSSIVRAAEKEFAYATDLKEENLTNNNVTSFYPQYSPDGKEVAYLENRTTLRIINLKSRAIRTVLGGEFNYSYSDGDQQFAWSPDSKWILSNYIGVGGWNNQDIVLVKADGSVVKNLTESGYSDGNARWVLGGKAMIWGSDRAGYRSHGSWGAEDDVYIMFFDVDAYDRFLMSKEDVARLDELEKEEKEKKEKAEKAQTSSKNKKDKKTDEAADKEVKELVLDLENAKDRLVRLTVNSSHLSD
ncbi:MAG: PD40 domain-containing protein, partial [Bacteroidaceae bacterium]|nr:PD40 domain-containing protein [Bacteroidaceae bacterium]